MIHFAQHFWHSHSILVSVLLGGYVVSVLLFWFIALSLSSFFSAKWRETFEVLFLISIWPLLAAWGLLLALYYGVKGLIKDRGSEMGSTPRRRGML